MLGHRALAVLFGLIQNFRGERPGRVVQASWTMAPGALPPVKLTAVSDAIEARAPVGHGTAVGRVVQPSGVNRDAASCSFSRQKAMGANS